MRCSRCGGYFFENPKRGYLFDEAPHLQDEWDYEKNIVEPVILTAGSNIKAWWKCKQGHSWQAKINSRTKGFNCPYCARQAQCISTEKQNKILDLCKNTSFSARQIGRLVGVSRMTVLDLCYKEKIRLPRKKQKMQILTLCKNTKLSFRQISEKTGVARKTVAKWCYDAKIRERPVRYSKEQKRHFFDIYLNSTLNLSEIAELLSIPEVILTKWLKKEMP